MVRIKHRWLLVQILYPASPPQISKKQQPDKDDFASLLSGQNPTLALHSPTPDSVNAQVLTRLLRSQIELLFGDYGAGMASATLAIKYWSAATSTFIVRCERAVFRLVWAALTFVKALPLSSHERQKRGKGGASANPNVSTDVPCVMQVLRVSGTIKKCEEELIRRSRALCGKVKGIAVALDAGVGPGEHVLVSDEEYDDERLDDASDDDVDMEDT